MNGQKKFHPATGPAFAEGEVWYGSSGSKVTIMSVRKYGDAKWDYEIKYMQSNNTVSTKNAWSFQVRYEHAADKNL